MTEKTTGKARHRSPGYPWLDLEHAIEFAQKFHDHAKRTAVPSEHAAAYWGFSATSSGWRLALAALKQFQLLESVGSKKSGEVKLTDLALAILLDTRSLSPERMEAIKRAALSPSVYNEAWRHFNGKLPDDATFQTYLTLNKNFNESAVAGFISDFKKTISFARLSEADIIPVAGATVPVAENDNDDDDGHDNDVQERRPRRRPMQAGVKEDTYTLDEGQVVIQWPERIDAEEIEDVQSWMQIVIRKMKRTAQKTDEAEED